MDKPVSRAHRAVDQRSTAVHGGHAAALPHKLTKARARGCSGGWNLTGDEGKQRGRPGDPHRGLHDGEDGLAAMATWNSTATRLEHGEMKWKGTRGMGRCCGALDAFYRPARRAEGSGGNELPAVLDYQCWLLWRIGDDGVGVDWWGEIKATGHWFNLTSHGHGRATDGGARCGGGGLGEARREMT
jgi:hypothetical protein